MKRTRANARTAGSAKYGRNVGAPTIATLGRIIRQQIESATDEVNELKLSHRAQAHQRRSTRRANNRRFGNRSVDHALRAELIDDAIGDFEGAAISAHVFADQKDSRVALHLFPNPSANCLDHRGGAAARRAFEFAFFFKCGGHVFQNQSRFEIFTGGLAGGRVSLSAMLGIIFFSSLRSFPLASMKVQLTPPSGEIPIMLPSD